jgi:phosphatidate cytidylyltransferase
VGVPAVLLLAWVGGRLFLLFVAALVALGLREFCRMARARSGAVLETSAIACGLALTAAAWMGGAPLMAAVLTPVVAFVLVRTLFSPERSTAIHAAFVTLGGILWVGWMGAHLVLLRELPRTVGGAYADGARFVWLALALTWSADTAAFAVGSAWGRHPLFTPVSPRKSIEGAVGALVACLAMGLLARSWFARFLGPVDAVVLALGVAACSLLGDLVESMVKRDAGVKDASRTLPGHGGILDRFDSVFFSAPWVYLYLRWAVLG